MIKICCDICGEPVDSYVDENGTLWRDFTVKERRRMKPRIEVGSFHESWWNELHICGRCRKAIVEFTKRGDAH